MNTLKLIKHPLLTPRKTIFPSNHSKSPSRGRATGNLTLISHWNFDWTELDSHCPAIISRQRIGSGDGLSLGKEETNRVTFGRNRRRFWSVSWVNDHTSLLNCSFKQRLQLFWFLQNFFLNPRPFPAQHQISQPFPRHFCDTFLSNCSQSLMKRTLRSPSPYLELSGRRVNTASTIPGEPLSLFV